MKPGRSHRMHEARSFRASDCIVFAELAPILRRRLIAESDLKSEKCASNGNRFVKVVVQLRRVRSFPRFRNRRSSAMLPGVTV